MNRTVPLLAAAAGLLCSVGAAFAGSATWLAAPTNNDWNTPANWTVGGPPNGPTDAATFDFSTVRELSFSAGAEVNGILFGNGGSTAYKITASGSVRLTISGSGITNNSGITQNFVAAGNNGLIQFINSASAGAATSFTTHGGIVEGSGFGVTEFRGNSRAANAELSTNGGAVMGAFGGVTRFFDSASAANGVLNNSGANTVAGSGVTLFHNSSTAGNAAITNRGGLIESRSGGFTHFYDTSSAENATVFNNGGGAPFASGGVVQFFDNSSAGAGTFTISAGAVNGAGGGVVQFWDTSTASLATFTIEGGTASGRGGGTLEFWENSSAGNGKFTTNGIAANFAVPGYTRFRDGATAGSGTFITNGGGTNGAAGGGFTEFLDSSTAGNATLTTNGAIVSDGSGGSTEFRNNSSAENATLVVNGSAFRREPCPPGVICGESPPRNGILLFFENATAANATLIAHGGIDGGDGGLILLASNGGSTRVQLFGNGNLDITIHEGPGITIGSLEGNGLVFLGDDSLTIGSNNLSTTFSGVIRDGGVNGASGGSLAKIGAGRLALSGPNTYTGPTTINEGTLTVDGSITSAVTINNGGTLGGSGTAGSVTVESGGIVAPGDSIGRLTINGSYTQKAGGVLKLEVAGTDPGASDHLGIAGSATIDGTLEVRFLNGFVPVTGQVFKLFDVAGALTGSFEKIIFPNLRTGFQFKAEFVNGSYQITALNDAVVAYGFLNISTRARVGTGDNALIGGFIITGNASQKVIIRALGPSLAVNGTSLPNRLDDPTLELRDQAGALIFSNDNWGNSPQKQQIIESTIPPADFREAAIVATLAPGNYTAIMRGVNNSTGIGLVEVYDLNGDVPSNLANISSRGLVETGDNVMIGGFIVDGQSSELLVRALGPSIKNQLPNALDDTTLDLHDSNGAMIASNDNWKDSPERMQIEGTGIPPSNDLESAIFRMLAPAPYTAIVRGKDNGIGVGVVEIYTIR